MHNVPIKSELNQTFYATSKFSLLLWVFALSSTSFSALSFPLLWTPSHQILCPFYGYKSFCVSWTKKLKEKQGWKIKLRGLLQQPNPLWIFSQVTQLFSFSFILSNIQNVHSALAKIQDILTFLLPELKIFKQQGATKSSDKTH